MAKGDDAIAKKRSKAIRKRMRKDSATSSLHAKGIIAAKRRIKDQKRRLCRGMCYSLPTPENPFNDKIEDISQKKQGGKKRVLPKFGIQEHFEKRDAVVQNSSFGEEEIDKSSQKGKKWKKNSLNKMEISELQKEIFQLNKVSEPAEDVDKSKKKKDKPSGTGSLFGRCRTSEGLTNLNIHAIPKMVFETSLDAIRNIELDECITPEGVQKLNLNNAWGKEFWKACSKGSNILGISKASFDLQQTAWIVSAVASHVISKVTKDSLICDPMVLYIVHSQEHAQKVRMVFKPLRKLLGLQAVSLHSGASVDHQIEGLSMCKPEILVSTPERILELVELKALDVSSVSFLVIDGLNSILEEYSAETLKSLRSQMSENPQAVILSNLYTGMTASLAQYILKDPVQRVSSDSSIILQSACIDQVVSVLTAEEMKLQKVLKVLRQINDKKSTVLARVVLVVNNARKAQQVVAAMEHKGYTVYSIMKSLQVKENIPGSGSEDNRLQIMVTTENLLQACVLNEAQFLILYDFPSSLQSYRKLLTGMARFSVMGILYSFCSGADAPLAAELIKLLGECSQPVPQTLRMLADAASAIQC